MFQCRVALRPSVLLVISGRGGVQWSLASPTPCFEVQTCLTFASSRISKPNSIFLLVLNLPLLSSACLYQSDRSRYRGNPRFPCACRASSTRVWPGPGAMDGFSIIRDHQNSIIETIRRITQGDWKVLVLDETTRQIIDSSVNEDDILNHNIANIERIEERRAPNPDMDAIYFLSPKPHIVDCLLADFERRRYRSGFLVWTGALPDYLRRKLEVAQRQIAAQPPSLLVDFFPRESHLVTFRDPHGFLILYNPFCNNIVEGYLKELAQKIASVCITLGERPKVRYYQPKNKNYEANVLCKFLANFVWEELNTYAERNKNFPPPSARPQSVLLITDRTMDLMAPLLHELTYQAMVHDLLPIKEEQDGKVTYHMVINEGAPNEEEKDMPLHDKDSVWVQYRHRHIQDTVEKLPDDFQKFRNQNPNFSGQNQNNTSLNDIRDMMAGLPQYTEMKEAYSLHVNMAQEVKNIFAKHNLIDVTEAEQTLATGLDEKFGKPKGILEEVVKLLADPSVVPNDRLRLIAIYSLFRDGMIAEDILRLLWHAQLQRSRDSTDKLVIENLELLGARPLKGLKETRQPIPPLFPPKIEENNNNTNSLSRFEPAVKHMLEDLCNNNKLDLTVFPYHEKEQRDEQEGSQNQASLRSTAPRWASSNRRQVETRQRIIVFVAGGATYSEARACYEVSEKHNRDVILATSHTVSPAKFVEDLRLLNADRRRLNLPQDQPPPKAPAHLFERPAPPPQQQRPQAPPGMGGPPGMGMGGQMPAGGPRPPTKALGAMTLSSGGSGHAVIDHQRSSSTASAASGSGGKKDKDGKEKEKKKRNIFGIKK
ncbi:protein transport protein sec1 [Cladorrhinum sp. PSN332]|nr:protein transport protein sec1 [Cladorrhinum sp. PSN332]